jgi:hypothetical protein
VTSLRLCAVCILCSTLPMSQTAAQVGGGGSYTPAPQQQAFDPATQSIPAASQGQWMTYGLQLVATGSPDNRARAFAIFRNMTHDGNVQAARQAAWMALNGVGIPRDPQYATAVLQWLGKGGDAWAMTQLGGCYRRGDGVPWNEGVAMQWFKAAAQRANDPEAESEIGRGYLNGLGPDTTDYAAAASWLQRASRQGYQPAQLQLGYMYQRGWGVTQDRSAAASLYRAAANSRDPQVQKTAYQLQQSLQHDQSDSDGKAVLAVLGVLAVAAIAASSSSSSSTASTPSASTSSGSSSIADANAEAKERNDRFYESQRLAREQEQADYQRQQEQQRQQQERDRINMDNRCGFGRYC